MKILFTYIAPILTLLIAVYGIILQKKQEKRIKMRCLVNWPTEIGFNLCRQFNLFTLLYDNKPIDEGKIHVAEFQFVNESDKNVDIISDNIITITLPETCHVLDVKTVTDIISVTYANNNITISLPNSVMKKDKFVIFALFKNTVEERPIPEFNTRITNIDIINSTQEEGNTILDYSKNILLSKPNFFKHFYAIIIILLLLYLCSFYLFLK